MGKSAKLQQSVKTTIVPLEHIGMDSSVLVMQICALKELNGQEVIAKLLKKNVKLANIGVETGVLLFQVNVLINLSGMILKIDVFLSIMSVQVEHIIMDSVVYLTVNVKTTKFGVIL